MLGTFEARGGDVMKVVEISSILPVREIHKGS